MVFIDPVKVLKEFTHFKRTTVTAKMAVDCHRCGGEMVVGKEKSKCSDCGHISRVMKWDVDFEKNE